MGNAGLKVLVFELILNFLAFCYLIAQTDEVLLSASSDVLTSWDDKGHSIANVADMASINESSVDRIIKRRLRWQLIVKPG